ncbi:hypothetical protein Ndes2437B_g03320 [Nannochloris sp. 'desiccata']
MTSNVGLKGLRGTLESALESDDISPLIKLVSASSTARQTTEVEDAAVSSSASPASNSKKKDDGGLAIAEGTLKGVIQTLQGISDRRDLELKRTCQSNSAEISYALKELSAVQATSADLRRRAQETSASMQRMGAHFSSRMDALDEALLVRDRIQHTRSALATAMHIISLCEAAAESIESGQLYHARRVLIALKTRHGPALKASAAAGEHGEHGTAAFQFEGPPATQLGSLAAKLLARINELDSKVDVRLTSCLNEWLTQARAGAGAVGRRALELMEAEKKRNVVLAEQRRQMWLLQKAEEGNGMDVAAALKNKLLLSSNRASTINNNSLNDARTRDNDDKYDDEILISDPASIVDMTLLLRCVHVHSSDNTLSQLLESYVEARQAQLGADLAPPGDLLVCHRAFLWQIVGFFVLETRVGLIAPQLETSSHAEASWEGASAALAAELGAAIDEASRPEDIRELKNQALLACDAIDRYCGDALSTSGIRSTLTSRVNRVRATMASGVAAALEEVAAAPIEGHNKIDSISSSSSFSSSIMAIKKSKMEALVTRLSEDCSEYMSGLVEAHELPAATCIEVDHILAAAISTKVAAFIIKEGTNQDDAYLTTDSDEEDDSSWDSEEEKSSEDENSEASISGTGSVSSLYSDGAENSIRRCSSDSQNEEEDENDNEEDDERSTIEDGEDIQDEEEELFLHLLQVVSIAAAGENALNALRLQLLEPSTTGTPTTPSPSPLDSSSIYNSNSPTTQLSGALMATEDAAGRRIAHNAYSAVDALADLDWSPRSMPRAAGGANISPQCAEIVDVLKAGRGALEACGVPVVSQQRILASAAKKIEEEIMRLLVSDAVPYINVFGAQKLLSDLQILSKFATDSRLRTAPTSTSTAGSEEWASEPILFGEIIAFNKASELLDAGKRGGKYASVNLDRFALLLQKVKDPTGPLSAVGRGFLKSEDARRVALELKNILLAERGSVS